MNTVWSWIHVVTIEVISSQSFKNVCFTGGFKYHYIINTTADVKIVTKFGGNQIITQIKKY